jgi:hypothetical protein
MGWGRYFLLGDWGQQMDLEDQRQDIDRLKRRLEMQAPPPAESLRLTGEINELKLYIAAIFRVLVTKKIVSQHELKDLIHAIDQEDGKIDNAFEGDPTSPGE